jgi:hypothetical protein
MKLTFQNNMSSSTPSYINLSNQGIWNKLLFVNKAVISFSVRRAAYIYFFSKFLLRVQALRDTDAKLSQINFPVYRAESPRGKIGQIKSN